MPGLISERKSNWGLDVMLKSAIFEKKKKKLFLFFKKNLDSLHARLNSHCKAQSYKKKEHKKSKAHRKSV